MKYIIKKHTFYNRRDNGYYYITNVVSMPTLCELVRKTAFNTYEEANNFLTQIITRDNSYRSKGFEFSYDILEEE